MEEIRWNSGVSSLWTCSFSQSAIDLAPHLGKSVNSTFTSSEPGVQATSSLRGYLETSFQSLRVTG